MLRLVYSLTCASALEGALRILMRRPKRHAARRFSVSRSGAPRGGRTPNNVQICIARLRRWPSHLDNASHFSHVFRFHRRCTKLRQMYCACSLLPLLRAPSTCLVIPSSPESLHYMCLCLLFVGALQRPSATPVVRRRRTAPTVIWCLRTAVLSFSPASARTITCGRPTRAHRTCTSARRAEAPHFPCRAQ